MATTRAKFKLNSYTTTMHPPCKTLVNGEWIEQPAKEMRTLNFTPVYSDKPESENKKFWDASPSGSIQLGTVNKAAWEMFEIGKEYYVDFSPAPTE